MQTCPGYHLQIINGQGRRVSAEAVPAALAITGPQTGQDLVKGLVPELGPCPGID